MNSGTGVQSKSSANGHYLSVAKEVDYRGMEPCNNLHIGSLNSNLYVSMGTGYMTGYPPPPPEGEFLYCDRFGVGPCCLTNSLALAVNPPDPHLSTYVKGTYSKGNPCRKTEEFTL
jgi:hypothetical protein